MNSNSKTIVFIPGLWMTSLSWENWTKRYTDLGHTVIARNWPRMGGTVEEIRKNPDALAGISVEEIVDHYAGIVRELEEPPIIMGHSFGGLFTQILLDQGLGSAGVAIASAPVKGILLLPFSTLRVSFPALSNPFNTNKAAALTPEQFHYAFGNRLTEEESKRAYERYAVPGPDHVLFQAAFANFNPHAVTAVDFHNDERAPLLLIAGGHDHVSPASVIRANYHLYRKSTSVTDYMEYPDRTHFILAEPGWEDVADYALNWAVNAADLKSPSIA